MAIEIFGAYRPWSREALKEVTDRIIAGAELTICEHKKLAWVDKYKNYGKDCKEIYIDLARMYVLMGWVGADSGNLETGETHYTFNMR